MDLCQRESRVQSPFLLLYFSGPRDQSSNREEREQMSVWKRLDFTIIFINDNSTSIGLYEVLNFFYFIFF